MVGNSSSGVVRAVRLSASATIPEKSSTGAAGFDLFADERACIAAHSSTQVKTGISMEIPGGFYGKICSRSGMAFRHSVFAFDGTIDSDYRGEISVLLENKNSNSVRINPGDRIAQIVIIRINDNTDIEEVDSLSETDRGVNGFGSTGI